MVDSQHPTLGGTCRISNHDWQTAQNALYHVHIEVKHTAYICELISGGLGRC